MNNKTHNLQIGKFYRTSNGVGRFDSQRQGVLDFQLANRSWLGVFFSELPLIEANEQEIAAYHAEFKKANDGSHIVKWYNDAAKKGWDRA